MKRFLATLLAILVLLATIECSAASLREISKTGLLIIAPLDFKTQDFLKIAASAFGKKYEISQDTQDAWATYCWDRNLVDSDPQIKRETLAEFAKTTRYDQIIFIVMKDAVYTEEDLGKSVSVSKWGASENVNIRRRTHLDARIVLMNKQGETIRVFEDAYTDASTTSRLRANRDAFGGLCKSISKRLNEKTVSK